MDRTAGEAGEMGLRGEVSVCEAGLARAGGNQPGWRTEVSQDRTKGFSAKLWARCDGGAGFPEVARQRPHNRKIFGQGSASNAGEPLQKAAGTEKRKLL